MRRGNDRGSRHPAVNSALVSRVEQLAHDDQEQRYLLHRLDLARQYGPRAAVVKRTPKSLHEIQVIQREADSDQQLLLAYENGVSRLAHLSEYIAQVPLYNEGLREAETRRERVSKTPDAATLEHIGMPGPLPPGNHDLRDLGRRGLERVDGDQILLDPAV